MLLAVQFIICSYAEGVTSLLQGKKRKAKAAAAAAVKNSSPENPAAEEGPFAVLVWTSFYEAKTQAVLQCPSTYLLVAAHATSASEELSTFIAMN